MKILNSLNMAFMKVGDKKNVFGVCLSMGECLLVFPLNIFFIVKHFPFLLGWHFILTRSYGLLYFCVTIGRSLLCSLMYVMKQYVYKENDIRLM